MTRIIQIITYGRIREVIRGYRKIQRSKNPLLLSQVSAELTNATIDIGARRMPRSMLVGIENRAEICIRQLLLSHLGGRFLNAQILLSIENEKRMIRYPLPDTWIQILESHGLRVHRSASKFLFVLYCASRFARDLLANIHGYLIAKLKPAPIITSPYVNFMGLSKNNIPIKNDEANFDIVSWYMKWEHRIRDLKSVLHGVRSPAISLGDVRVVYSRQPIPSLKGLGKIALHFFWTTKLLAFIVVAALRGNVAWLLLFRELKMAHKFSLLSADEVASDYLFSCSDHICRPFWTYVAENRGAHVTLYYYSASIPFSFRGRLPSYELGLQSMTWERILTFSSHQKAFLDEALGRSATVTKVPSIHFSDYPAEVPKTKRLSIALFDVTPVRISERSLIAAPDDYRIGRVGVKFLQDLYEVVTEAGYVIVWKKKRTTTKTANKQYMSFASQFGKREGVVEVHPDVSAARVINVCVAAISMAFTSTGLLAKSAGKQSVFYDPTGDLRTDDPAALGVPVLVGKEELKTWIAGLNVNQP
jgi:polysaccharide biosynthesis PFTS motif protein